MPISAVGWRGETGQSHVTKARRGYEAICLTCGDIEYRSQRYDQ
jgi:hypothetical protein